MARWKLLIGVGVAFGATGCVATHQERVALRMGWPPPQPAALGAFAPPNTDYPSVGGDILKAALPATQAAPVPPPP